MMKIKSLVIISILIAFTPDLNAGELLYQQYNNSVGLKASNISGYGFYYNRKMTENFRIQLMGLAYYYYNSEENYLRKNFNYDLGLEFQYDMYKSGNSRVYILAGAYYYIDDDSIEEETTKTVELTNSYNAGIGAAWEYYYKRFILGIDLGYKFFEDRKEITVNNAVPYPELYRVTKIGAGISVGFVF